VFGSEGNCQVSWLRFVKSHVFPAKAGIQFFRTRTPACAGVTTLILICSGGPGAHGNFVKSHVIPAKAGIHGTWVPACAGTTTFVTFRSMGGPQAPGTQSDRKAMTIDNGQRTTDDGLRSAT